MVGGLDPAAVHTRFIAHLDSIGETHPDWLTVELLGSVHARVRTLPGRWRATPFGAPQELRFEWPRDPRPT